MDYPLSTTKYPGNRKTRRLFTKEDNLLISLMWGEEEEDFLREDNGSDQSRLEIFIQTTHRP